MNSKLLIKIFAAFITIVLLALLFTQINLADIITTLKNINPFYPIAGFILYTCIYLFRAWRFHILLNKEVSIKDLFQIEGVHNMMNNLLPARTGELSYIYLLNKTNSRTIGEGVATLVVARIFDFIAMTILFFAAILMVQDIPPIIKDALWMIAVFVITLLFVLGMILSRGRSFVNLITTIMKSIHIEKYRISLYCLKKGFETTDSLEKIKVKNSIGQIVMLSILIWGFNYLLVYFLIVGMNFQLSFLIVILGCTFISLTTVLPIQGIGGFGSTEAVWTLVFVPLGMSLSDAIISGFCIHIVMIFYFIILGIYGWIKIRC
jgi:uncharacterized protein (TIRG00374 family)